jgi:predicted nucleic acid-binding protein
VKPFLDTNVLIYAQQDDPRSERALMLLEAGGIASAQVLNEFVNVMRNKLRLPWPEIERALADVRDVLDPVVLPVTIETSMAAVCLARDHGLAFYDALIVAAAIEAGCDTLWSEDMQHGRTIGGVTIRDPFLEAA